TRRQRLQNDANVMAWGHHPDEACRTLSAGPEPLISQSTVSRLENQHRLRWSLSTAVAIDRQATALCSVSRDSNFRSRRSIGVSHPVRRILALTLAPSRCRRTEIAFGTGWPTCERYC